MYFVIRPKKELTPEEWDSMMSRFGNYYRFHSEENGEILFHPDTIFPKFERIADNLQFDVDVNIRHDSGGNTNYIYEW